MLVIYPDDCIDCALCVPECPVNAIYADDDVPADQLEFIKLNAELSQKLGWKPIIKHKPAPADADEWRDKPNKLAFLER
jgi:ferredoxin